MKVIINSPSLNPEENVSGISSVVQFIINNNRSTEYVHFEIGKKDKESPDILSRITRINNNLKQWKQLLQQNKNAIIHYNMPLMGAAIIRDYQFLRIAHKAGMPIVLHVHGGNYLKNRKRPWYLRKMLNRIFQWSKSTIVLGEEESLILKKDFNIKEIHTLPNCVDLNEANNFNRTINTERPLNILYIGRIEINKGIEYIHQATDKLNKKGVDFHLHLAGKEENEGEFIPRIEESLKEKFTFHNVVSGERKTELLKQCDIFLLPSFFEGLPMSLIETMSFGQVPIVTAVGSIPGIVKDKENGIFIKVKDTETIIEAITTLYNDTKLRATLSKNARETVLNKFDDKKYINKLNNIYQRYV